jgi:ligand-binding sensor domain-containing protein
VLSNAKLNQLLLGRAVCARQRKLLIASAVLLLLVCLFGAWRVNREAQMRLARVRAQLERADVIPFDVIARPAFDRPGIQLWQDTSRARAIARFRDNYFVATDGGLLEVSPQGQVVRHYTVLDGLPESELTCLAAWQERLYIGTRTQGLAAFDGARFESYRWTGRTPQAITALAVSADGLLVGTFAGGLAEFDGREFRALRPGADGRDLPAINCLVRDGARLYVGTFADGLWLNEADRWQHFTTDAGLPSNRVVGVVADGARIFVATDFGLASASMSSLSVAPPTEGKIFQPVGTLPALAGMLRFNGRILLCKDDGHLFVLDDQTRAPQFAPRAWSDAAEPGLTDCRLLALDDELWLLTSAGIRRTHLTSDDVTNKTAAFALTPFVANEAPRELGSNIISALALDSAGRLWVGSFRAGIDLLTPDGRRLTHLDTEAAREINALVNEPDTNAMLAATAQGLVRFDADGTRAMRLTAADGLLSNSVTHVAVLSTQPAHASAKQTTGAAHHAQAAALVCATGRGLSFNTAGQWRALTAVQGLPSNSLYAVCPRGRSLFVGTLGGLAEVEAGRVVRVFTDANSHLTHNWVTALCVVGERLFVGTYGGGVFELTPAGELRPMNDATGQFAVNPNALWSDGARLYAGTTNGAWVYDLRAQRWQHLQAELPAPTVLSITGDDRHVYFGTTGGIARIETSYFEQT